MEGDIDHQRQVVRVYIHTMRCKVCYAADGVALDLYVWTEHLSNEGFEAAEFDDEELVVGWREMIHMG